MTIALQLISKEELIQKLREIEARGWIKCPGKRKNNDGAVGNFLEDFDARTGHNHGTKFRIKSKDIPMLYKEAIRVV